MNKNGKTKKFLCNLFSALMLCTAFGSLASCGFSGDLGANFDVPEGGYDGSKQTVTFYHTMGQDLEAKLSEAVVRFNKLYPNITIDHKQVGGYDDVRNQIRRELTAGNQPSMAYCYPDHVALYNVAGGVVHLDNLIASDIEVTRADGTKEKLGLTEEQIADFIPGYYNEGKAFGDGKMYMMPFSKSTEVFYYDKTFFDKYNLEVPETWDELETLCARILEIDPKCIPLGYDSEANWFITMCEQYGSDYTSATGDHFIFDNETNWNFVAEFREWYQKGYVTTQEILGAYTSTLFTEQGVDKDGNPETRCYMTIGSSAGATKQCPTPDDKGNYPFEVGIATIPQVNPENPKVISQGPSLCIFQDKQNPQEVVASWLFTKFITTDVQFQSDFSIVSGYVPVIQSVEYDEYYSAFLSKANGGAFVSALSAKTCMDQVDAYYVSPAFKGSSVARDQVGALMQYCFMEAPETKGEAAMDIIKNAFDAAVAECEYQA